MRETHHLITQYTWVDWMKDSASTWNTVDVYSIEKDVSTNGWDKYVKKTY